MFDKTILFAYSRPSIDKLLLLLSSTIVKDLCIQSTKVQKLLFLS